MSTELDAFFVTMRSYAYEEFSIAVLERELHKRKVRRTSLATQLAEMKLRLESLLSEDQRQALSDHTTVVVDKVAEDIKKEQIQKLRIGDNSWALESEVLPDLVFDNPEYDIPNVLVFTPNASPVVIDVRKSLEKDSKNIGNPFIVAAINRYVDYLSLPTMKDFARRRDRNVQTPDLRNLPSGALTHEKADKGVKAVFDSLIAGARLSARKQLDALNEMELVTNLSRETLSEEFFEKLAKFLNTPDIKRLRRLNLPTNIRSKLANHLTPLLSSLEERKRIIEFIDKAELPKKLTGPSLRNCFFAFERSIASDSFRRYKTQIVQKMRRMAEVFPPDSDSPLNEKDIGQLSRTALDRILLHRGSGTLEVYSDVRGSNLVWQEFSQPSSVSCQDQSQITGPHKNDDNK